MEDNRNTAVVLGGYGLIGAACVRALRQAGFDVVGVGRSKATAWRVLPDIEWRILDLAQASVDDLKRAVGGAHVIVNAAGALQDGLNDDVAAIHESMITRLVIALHGGATRVIQISAAGVRFDSSTEFFRSKARGDALLMASELDWVVLRPTLVLAREAYGGTSLLRASAAMPFTGFDVFPDSRVQTVFIDDVAAAVVAAARGEVAGGTIADLTEPDSHSFGELVREMRSWLGLPSWQASIGVPGILIRASVKVADALGRIGWRSPLRSTAITVLGEGIHGDPSAWAKAGGRPCRALGETLAAMPATAQERWFARLYLLLPMIVGTLALFWILSGLIALARFAAAREVLTSRGMSAGAAGLLVVGGALVDLALGAGVLVRRYARSAAVGMVAVSLTYLVGGTILAPDLLVDPLGPLVKILPALTLGVIGAALLDER
jgi:uncharacterized protein YbjT (DUF2867 family)